MIVSVVFDTEYMGVAERNKWFLKSVSQAMKEDVIIVTHSYFRDHLKEVVEACDDRFYNEFEMDKYSVEEIQKLNICYVPDEMFDSTYRICGSRTKQLSYLYNNDVTEIEEYIVDYVDGVLKTREIEKPDYIMNSLHVFGFVKSIAKHYGCPIIPWVFSAIRKVHGYSQTLYMAHIDEDLFNSESCKIMYETRNTEDFGFSELNKKEILALLGKAHNMSLLPLIDREGTHEVGIVGEGFHIIPETYQHDSVTDDDIYYECKRLYGADNIVTRLHPIQLDQVGIGRKHMKNDPVAFILGCKRIVTVQSQMIMKAAMWNRAPVTMSDALPYSYLLNRDIAEAKPIDDYKLNFILFVYFIPDACMFSADYWKWRMNNPTTKEIAMRHIEAILSDLNIPLEVIYEKNRMQKFLLYRKIPEECIRVIMKSISKLEALSVPYKYPSSYIKAWRKEGSVDNIYCLNKNNYDDIESYFSIPEDTSKVGLVLQNDIDGCVEIKEIIMDNKNILGIQREYVAKNESIIEIPVEKGNKQMKVIWNIKKFDFNRGGGTD